MAKLELKLEFRHLGRREDERPSSRRKETARFFSEA